MCLQELHFGNIRMCCCIYEHQLIEPQVRGPFSDSRQPWYGVLQDGWVKMLYAIRLDYCNSLYRGIGGGLLDR